MKSSFSYLLPIISVIIILFSCYSCTKKEIKRSPDLIKAIEINNLLNKSKKNPVYTNYQFANKALNLAQKANNDTLICKSWLVLGSIQRFQGKNDDALSLFQLSLDLSKKIHYEHSICESLNEIGSIYYIRGIYDKAGEKFYEALVLARKNHFTDLEAISLNYMGKYCHTTGKFEESVKYYKQSIDLYKKIGHSLQSASVLLSLGKTYNNEGNLFMALKCYLHAYNICEEANDYLNLADACNHLGGFYLALNQPIRSMEYHQKSLAYREQLKNPDGIAKSYNNIGEVLLITNKPDSAILFFYKSLELCEQLIYTKGKVKALTNLGKGFNMKLKPVLAKNLLLQSLAISLKSGYDAGVAESSLELGNTFLKLQLLDSAKQSYDICLNKAKSANLTELNHDGYWGLYQICLIKKDFAKALQYYTLFSQAEKKLIQAENNYQLAELRVNFESEKQEKDNMLLREENKIKEILIWMIIIALIFSIIFIILLYSRFANKRKANKHLEQLNNQVISQNKNLENLNKDLEIANYDKDKIFSIISHELRNPLFWFQNLTEMLSLRYHLMSQEKLQKSLLALDESAKNAFHLMDNLLFWSRSRLNRINPKKAIYSLRSLVEESLRMYETIIQYKEIKLNITIPESVDVFADSDLLNCVIRNLVSNAIKYTPVKGEISINCSVDNDFITVLVNDNGMGINCENPENLFINEKNISNPGLMNEKGSGLGLKLCKEFVELNGGKIWITKNDDIGTRFLFTVMNGKQNTNTLI